VAFRATFPDYWLRHKGCPAGSGAQPEGLRVSVQLGSSRRASQHGQRGATASPRQAAQASTEQSTSAEAAVEVTDDAGDASSTVSDDTAAAVQGDISTAGIDVQVRQALVSAEFWDMTV
jgi:hypothetical protein